MNNSHTIDAAIDRVRAFAKAQNWKKTRLAMEAGLQDTTLRNFDRPTWNPMASTLRKLETVIPADFEVTEEAT